MEQLEYERPASKRNFGLAKIVLIGMAGYLLGSFFPAGFVRYFIQSKIFPETVASGEPEFDASILKNAINVTPMQLTSALDANPSLFRQRYLNRPVRLTGEIQYFLDSPLGEDKMVLTLHTGDEYGATSIIMTFENANASGMSTLRKGGSVTARCIATGITTESVHLGHCELSK